jgi:hypothetical protein
VRACLQFLGMNEGVEIHHVADLPARTGLGKRHLFSELIPSQGRYLFGFGGPVLYEHGVVG